MLAVSPSLCTDRLTVRDGDGLLLATWSLDLLVHSPEGRTAPHADVRKHGPLADALAPPHLWSRARGGVIEVERGWGTAMLLL